MSDKVEDEVYRTIEEARVKPADVYARDGVDKEFELIIDGQKISGPFASDYPLLTEILALFELPVTESGVESLVGCEVPVFLDEYTEEWTQLDGDLIRERIELGRVEQ